jgi:hypothetical protein
MNDTTAQTIAHHTGIAGGEVARYGWCTCGWESSRHHDRTADCIDRMIDQHITEVPA